MAKMLMIQIQATPYAGIAYLNAAAKSSGHDFILHIGNKAEKILSDIFKHKPDIIGFTCMSSFHKEIINLAAEIKKDIDTPIILGGPHPTLFSEVINEPCIDIICRGEGEFALIDLLNAIEEKRSYAEIKNLWVKDGEKIYKNELRPLADPMDDIPLIDWSCYENTPVQNSSPSAFLIRGCPYSCTYCFNETTRKMCKGLGKYVRHFSVERSIQEIKQALKVFERSPVIFTSDSFGIDLKWSEELFKKYSKLTDLPFVLLLRPELATEKCINILAKHDCYSVALGVESGSERVRHAIMNRNYSNELLLEVAERLHLRGIKFRTYNMIGLPTETEKEIWDTIDINIKMKTDFPRGAIFTPMPDTKIVDLAMKEGYLDKSFSFNSIPETILSETILKKINKNRIKNTLYFFQTAIKFPWSRMIIKKLIRMKPNILFRYWFYLVYVYLHKKSEKRTLIPYIKFIFANRHYR